MTPNITKKEIEEIIEDAKHLLENWLKFKKYLQKSFTQEPISMEDETDFLESKSIIAKNQRMVGEKVKDMFYYGADKIQALTRQCISVAHLRSLPILDRRNLLVEWHMVYVRITQLAGALALMKEGYIPKVKVKGGTSIASVKAGASGSGKEKKKFDAATIFKYIVIAGILCGAVVWFLKKSGKM